MTGQTFFCGEVAVTDKELARLPAGVKLVPVMPAEAYIRTWNRTVLAYLIHPFTEQLNQAFREAD